MLMFAPMITIQFKLKIIIADQPDKELWLHHQVCCKVVDVSRSVHQAEYETLYCVVFFFFRKFSCSVHHAQYEKLSCVVIFHFRKKFPHCELECGH